MSNNIQILTLEKVKHMFNLRKQLNAVCFRYRLFFFFWRKKIIIGNGGVSNSTDSHRRIVGCIRLFHRVLSVILYPELEMVEV